MTTNQLENAINLAIVAGVGLATFLAYKAVKGSASAVGNAFDAAGSVVGTAAQAVNPASSQNLIYRGLNGLGTLVTGDDGYTVGGALYDAAQLANKAADELNPTNPGNIFYEGVNGIGGSISGDPNWTLGGWIYDITH